jgi:hypothetical protein
MKSLVCDFCTRPNPVWMFKQPEIDVPALHIQMNAGYMAACEICSELLVAGEIEALITRALDANQPEFSGDARLRDMFRGIYTKVSRVREVALSTEEYDKLYPNADGYKFKESKLTEKARGDL